MMEKANLKITIRSATKKDLDDILAVERSAFPPERQAEKKTFENRLELFPEGFLVLFVNSELVGISTALSISEPNDLEEIEGADKKISDRKGSSYYFRSVAIKKEFQKRGLGTMLVKKQIENAKKLGKKWFVFSAANDVEEYYLKLGFNRLGGYKPFHNSMQALWKTKL